MSYFPVGHIITSLCTVLVAHLLGNCWIGAFVASAIYVSREETQAEYRWIQKYGDGKRANLRWYSIFNKNIWNTKSICDFVVPAVAAFLLCCIL